MYIVQYTEGRHDEYQVVNMFVTEDKDLVERYVIKANRILAAVQTFFIELDSDEEDLLVEWGRHNEDTVHQYAIKAAVDLHNTGKPGDYIVIIEFFTSKADIIPFADILVDYEEIAAVFDDAESYYVRVENYEKAAEVKTIRDSLNIKTKLYGK